MSVSHRVTGTWAELVADGTVAIPATPQAGDRMYLFARWKDFSITASVANWTELTEFVDGSVSSGNGTGSVKVGCWYRDWQSGDTDPTIDFSASPTNASVVIIVMQKGADDVWDTPLARTAAMTNWTTSSQSVSASAAVTVPGSGVVMGLIGIRDDTATMTRPTNGIDDSGGLVTWNGNYAESPATHHSTTTGDDGAADLGYRLVTTGAANATLRMTGTISAAETGAALWVVQGVSTIVTPSTLTLTASQFAPLVLLVVIPATAVVASTQFAPQLRLAITPPASTLTAAGFAPQLQQTLTPAIASLSITTSAPRTGTGVVPATATVTVSALSPTLLLSRLITVPSTSLTITTTRPHVQPYRIKWLDPGGDAVQAVGYFNTEPLGSDGDVSFDNTQKVVGIGSWKFDSVGGEPAVLHVPNVLAPSFGEPGNIGRRISFWWRYDSIPDATETVTDFVNSAGGTAYSGGGFTGDVNLASDNSSYATAAPAKNAGQGTVFGFDQAPSLGGAIPPSAVIDSVTIIYERKYDVDTSIGISRVKWRIDGVEGPDHDNTDQPLTDTVVEVDVTADRSWEPQDFAMFAVIAEARRGDTDTSHTQSWDYVKVEVVYHLPAGILDLLSTTNTDRVQVVVTPKGSGVVLGFVPEGEYGYYGITQLLPDTWNRISLAWIHHDADDLDIRVFVNKVEELAIDGATSAGAFPLPNLQYGWTTSPGASHVCWFDQIYVDDGDDLSDPGNKLMTAKLPASVNQNEWTTTGGTGAVNERPVSETNYKQHSIDTGTVYQTYTLQTAATGDVDISTETLVGYMAWAWAKRNPGSVSESINLIANGVDKEPLTGYIGAQLGVTPSFIYFPASSGTYPSNAAGIGLGIVNAEDINNGVLYECGIVVCYEGPPEEILFAEYLLLEDFSVEVFDDLRAILPDTYLLRYWVGEQGGTVTIKVYSISAEGESFQLRTSIQSGAGSGLAPINAPGIELRILMEVTDADTFVTLQHYFNV